jgi:hypothetical protein
MGAWACVPILCGSAFFPNCFGWPGVRKFGNDDRFDGIAPLSSCVQERRTAGPSAALGMTRGGWCFRGDLPSG